MKQEYSITIKGVAPKITSKSLPDGNVGTAYSTKLEVTGSSTITWSASELPSGLDITEDGTISGTPSESGTFTVSITAENDAKSVTKKFKLKVSASSHSFTKQSNEK